MTKRSHTKTALYVYSDVPWFRSTSVLLLLSRLVYVTGKVENRAKTLYWLILLISFHYSRFQYVGCFSSFALFSLFASCSVLNWVHIVLDSCAADFRKLTSLLLIHVRSRSCIPLASTSMTGSFASVSLYLLFHIPLFFFHPSSLPWYHLFSPILLFTFLSLSLSPPSDALSVFVCCPYIPSLPSPTLLVCL